jgi:hypothetical protein
MGLSNVSNTEELVSPKRITDATSPHAIDVAMSQYLNNTGAGDYDLP